MSIQVKDGWWYKNRIGDVVQAFGNPTSVSAYRFAYLLDDEKVTVDERGEYYTGGEGDDWDLVEEIGPFNTVVNIPEHPPYNHDPNTHSLSEALTCYVSFRDTPDVEALPDNTYAHILLNGALLVRTLGDDRQVALFAPNSWVNYVNKGAK